jgi:hypothetical protein
MTTRGIKSHNRVAVQKREHLPRRVVIAIIYVGDTEVRTWAAICTGDPRMFRWDGVLRLNIARRYKLPEGGSRRRVNEHNDRETRYRMKQVANRYTCRNHASCFNTTPGATTVSLVPEKIQTREFFMCDAASHVKLSTQKSNSVLSTAKSIRSGDVMHALSAISRLNWAQ